MAKKKKCPEHVDHERWLVSYADFITLLFAFFVVMYATASVNLGKYKILSDSLYGAFTGQPRVPEPIQIGIISKSPNLNTHLKKKVKDMMKKKIKIQKFTNVTELVGGKTPQDESEKKDPTSKKDPTKPTPTKADSQSKKKTTKSQAKEKQQKQNKFQPPSTTKSDSQAKSQNPKAAKSKESTKDKVLMGKLMAKISQKLKKQFSNLINKDRVKIRHNNKLIAIELNNHFFFKKGKYGLTKASVPVVGRIVDVLKKYPDFPIVVEGHTGKGLADMSEDLSPWELSSLRASALVHVLTDFSIPPNRLSVSSYASFKPAYSNKTKKGRNMNRRTTILIKADPQNIEFLRLLKRMPDIDYEKIYDYDNK